MIYKRLVVNIKTWEIRNKKKVTLKQLSILTGLSVSTLNNIENNKTDPKITQLVKIAKALEVQIEELYDINYK